MHFAKYYLLLLTLIMGILGNAHASVPVPYAGKVSIDGINFHGQLKFMFAIYTASNDMVWDSGGDPIEVPVSNGRYLVLLGGQGMRPLPASLFHENDELYVGVYADLPNDNVGQVKLGEFQRITAQPYALVAEMAKIADVANSAKVADSVKAGAVTPQMIQSSSITANQMAQNTITTAQLNEQILKYLKPEITHTPQAPGLIFGGQTVTLLSQAEGKYLSYQWYKNGQPIAGATSDRYVIEDINKTQHDGNYSLVVSNDFGTVTTPTTTIDVNGTPTTHTVLSANNLEMIFCPPGTFMMGQEGVATPVHQVTLTNGFYLGKYEVTQAQYETVMTGNSEGLSAAPSQSKGTNRPVERVSWNDIQVFLSRLNDMEQTADRLPAGWKYVLPTEAQWEYACRAGTTTVYSWGNDINSTRANYKGNIGHTIDIGQYDPNSWGFFDMHGNVYEFIYDLSASYSSAPKFNPEGAAYGSARLSRGGSFLTGSLHLRSANRYSRGPDGRNGDLGFRLAFQSMPADTANPELELFGGAAINREAGQAWAEPGVEAHDARDGNITDQIVVTGTVDMNSTGTYLLSYTVQDGGGNTATATRTVTVVGNRTVDLNATVAMDMIWCPPGTFTMGSPTTEAGRGTDETEHNVSLTKGFYLGKYEVTQAQYEAVMTGNNNSLSADPSQFKGENRPVEKVSWDDAQVFLTRLNAQQAGNLPAGWSYVLPTESQWEYACRAGTTTIYSWGNSIGTWNANFYNSGINTSNAGVYPANPWGFFDMHGNVWEWTADWKADYSNLSQVNPEGPASGSSKVIRGGSSHTVATYLRSAKRNSNTTSYRYNYLGFRVALKKINPDTSNPEIHLFGGNIITHSQGISFSDPGAEAHDVRDGDITSQMVVTGSVDTNSTGTYLLTYMVQDEAGNTATATRTVTVVGNRSVDLNATVVMDMIWCPPGTFTMGSPTTEAGRNTNEAEHNVTLTNGFYLGKYEVTQAQYEAVMTGNTNSLSPTPSNWSNNPNRPVEKVSWDDAQVFLTRLNEQQAGNLPAGWSYVLPTESQWEYACRAGTTTVYSWGNDINSSRANYNWDGGGTTGNDFKQTRDVGQYAANPWGFFDMHGNVWEWTADWYDATYPTGNPVIDPTGPATPQEFSWGTGRVLRSGAWHEDFTQVRSSVRIASRPVDDNYHIGFRVSLQKSQ